MLEIIYHFIPIVVASAVLGGIVGLLSRGCLPLTLGLCVPLSIALLAALMLWDASTSGEKITWQNWQSGTVYYLMPFSLFIFAPCCVAGVLMTIVAHCLKARIKVQNANDEASA